ncbi:PREDICTED: protein FAM214B isoform X1 [Gavialis gangeticus]|uniref:protein FAM214B isoform X1 n=1 Tax=Gavialis gangeticus TaxID=94835 RepID=UPI00092FACAE|nr:PREDICTED: protein FAM214B isoform X1 [Gavialis gangeticus]XP_019373587.1 PREDICTED: protein FAM214B isoform X1 [Gavialis gangeticus]XP_019373588.1 PREDICTED: protein FAM214B isoform X1 [Gavialis gangeticus]XP_019373589.1 PREDICTED: protein FAM214B isoform X1 [Gavialis gangeticus]
MRHIHAETPLPPERSQDAGLSRAGGEAGLEPAPERCPRRGLLVGYNETEIKRQKVYQVSIFSHLSSASEPAGGRAAVKRGYTEPRAPESTRDPKRAQWGAAGTEGRQDGVPGELRPSQDALEDDAFEDGLLVEELSLCGSAQHFSHSGLRVVEHRGEGGSGRSGCRESGSRACPEDRRREAATASQPPHITRSTLHMRDGCPAPRDSGSAGSSEPPRPAGAREQPVEENGAPRADRASSQTLLDVDLHRIAQKPWVDTGSGKKEEPGSSPACSNGAGSEGEPPAAANGHKEPGTPPAAPGPVNNGLGSAEKTPGGRLGGGSCAAKRKLLPAGEGAADSCSEDEALSPPARKKRAPLCPPVPASGRSTDAKGAPFWNHLLPGARSSADCTTVGRRVKSGLRLKSRRHLRSSLRKGPVGTRPSPTAWAATSISRALLGNFEESILKGRFAPSGRIEGFTAEIGASGSYCPQHATLPVDVTYFDISEHSAPSPFLGVIDLEALGKKGYSVPKAGTIQVTLFNPNKTVVKMFLVTYDFQNMPAHHMTFLRHRIFLVPVGEDEEAGAVPSDPACAHPPRRVLCYLMHLRFHSSKSGKIYLHDDIRLLFSRKSIEVDSGIPYELKSFTEMPRNPCYSPRA